MKKPALRTLYKDGCFPFLLLALGEIRVTGRVTGSPFYRNLLSAGPIQDRMVLTG